MQINQLRPTGVSRSVVHEHFILSIQAYGDQAVRFGTHEIWCNVEYMKVAALDAMEAVGCRYLLNARAETMIDPNDLMPQTLALMLSNFDPNLIPPSDVRRVMTEVIHASRQKYPLNPSAFVEVEPMANSTTNWWGPDPR